MAAEPKPATVVLIPSRAPMRTRRIAALVAALALLAAGAGACRNGAGRNVLPSRTLGFPTGCEYAGRTLVIVPLDAVADIDVERLARRYREAYGLRVTVAPALAPPAAAFDDARRQWVGERLLDALQGARPGAAATFTVGLTSRDLYLRDMPWRFAFSAWRERTAVISTARMNPVFFGQLPDADRHDTRLYKMVTRFLGTALCGRPRTGSAGSVMRPTLLSLDDLDGIDESVWE